MCTDQLIRVIQLTRTQCALYRGAHARRNEFIGGRTPHQFSRAPKEARLQPCHNQPHVAERVSPRATARPTPISLQRSAGVAQGARRCVCTEESEGRCAVSRRKVLTALELVAHACGSDRSRPHLCSPFGFEWRGNGYIAGTDGHRAALVRSEEWQQHVRDDAPPMRAILDLAAAAPQVGSIYTYDLRMGRELPRKWRIRLTFPAAADEMPRLNIVVSTLKAWRRGSKEPFGPEIRVPWRGLALEHLRHPLAIELRYLLDAVDLIGTRTVNVHSTGELDPIVFVADYNSSVWDAERIAIVMPRRL